MRMLTSIGVCLALICAGAGVLYVLVFSQPPASAQQETAPPPALPEVSVRIDELRPQPFEDLLYLTGQLLAWEDLVISAEANGNVEWQGVEIGDEVAAGDELYRIDTVSIQADYARAAARLELAQEELQRYEGLQASGVGSAQAYDQARAEAKLARAELRSNEVRLERSIVRAPIDGVISMLEKEQGEFVDFGTALCGLVQIDRLNAAIPVPEKDIPFFSVGDTVVLRFDALPDREFEGTIFRIAPTADLATRTYLVEIEVQNDDRLLRPGMTARASMVRRIFEDSIVVPIFAIRALENQYFVMVEQDGIAHVRPIVPAQLQGNLVRVGSGLSAGDRLIISGHRELRDGAPVRVQEPEAS